MQINFLILDSIMFKFSLGRRKISFEGFQLCFLRKKRISVKQVSLKMLKLRQEHFVTPNKKGTADKKKLGKSTQFPCHYCWFLPNIFGQLTTCFKVAQRKNNTQKQVKNCLLTQKNTQTKTTQQPNNTLFVWGCPTTSSLTTFQRNLNEPPVKSVGHIPAKKRLLPRLLHGANF